jgi:hypothetical protein
MVGFTLNRSGSFVQALAMNSYGVRPLRVFHRLHKGKFVRAINGDIDIKLSLDILDLGNINGEAADGVGLERVLAWLISLNIR